MQRLGLDFANPQRSLKRPSFAISLALLVIGSMALGLAAWDCWRQSTTNSALQDREQVLRLKMTRGQLPDQLSGDLGKRVRQANAAYSLRQTHWEPIFQELESALQQRPSDVALLSIRGDAVARQVLLSGEARQFTALSNFSSTLSASPLFEQVSLVNDRLSDASVGVVRFDVRLTWRARPASAQ